MAWTSADMFKGEGGITYSLDFLLSLCSALTEEEKEPEIIKEKFILYDVNPGEGFNLRRDVFMRVAVLVRQADTCRL
jgi:hypothetical protein